MALESREIEEQVEELEERIERLRGLYEQYFMGLEKIEPQIPRKDVDRRVWLLRREQIRNTGLRFKFQMLVQRYNAFQQYWGRITREIENGTYKRDVLKAAKRFGEREALTAVGRKRADLYKKLADVQKEAQNEGRAAERPAGRSEPPSELDSLLAAAMHEKDSFDDDDDLPTPPPRRAEPPPLFTVPGRSAARPQPPPTDEAIPPAAKPAGGLRWGAAPPASDPEAVKRKVAALASALRRDRDEADASDDASGLSLDLDFESRRARGPSHRPPPGARAPLPPAALPSRPAGLVASTPRPDGGSARDVAPEAVPNASEPRPRAPAPAQPAGRPPPPKAPPSAEDARLRQIYSKYVESRRATNESTAGLTYEKLAESLHAQTNKLRTKHPGRKVDYEVVVKDGRTILKPILR